MKPRTITREGKRFLIATFLIAVAAVNTGNNLIYLVLSLMLSFIFLSEVLVNVNTRKLSIRVFHHPPLFASQEAKITVALSNNKRRITTYSVACMLPGTLRPAYFGKVKPLGTEQRDAEVLFQRRGLYRYGDFQLRSGYPFILLVRARRIPVQGALLVYPALRDVSGAIAERSGESMGAARRAESGDDMYALRDFRYGDDWRKIHWKASARAGELQVKEYADFQSEKVTIVLDNLLPEDGELFERTVSLAASFARHFIEKGCFVRIVSSTKIVSFGRGDEHLFKILDILAVIREEEAWRSPPQDAREGFFVTVMKSRRHANPYMATGEAVYAEDL